MRRARALVVAAHLFAAHHTQQRFVVRGVLVTATRGVTVLRTARAPPFMLDHAMSLLERFLAVPTEHFFVVGKLRRLQHALRSRVNSACAATHAPADHSRTHSE
jgi:hypothetical protein